MDDGRGWFRTSPEGERCEEISPGAQHGRWARLVSSEPEGERCEEISPGARHGRWARLVSNQRPLACEASALPLSYAPGGRIIGGAGLPQSAPTCRAQIALTPAPRGGRPGAACEDSWREG